MNVYRNVFRLTFIFLAVGLSGCGDDAGSVDARCEPGQPGCACLDEGGCEAGSTCDMNLCTATTEVGLQISDARARGCDALLTEGRDRVGSVSFAAGVMGTFVREAPRVAVSFIATGDTPLDGNAIQVRVLGSGSDVSVDSVKCVGADAELLKGTSIALAR